MTPEVTVVVVTHNGPEWVERCLQALLVDARPAVRTEVVVVDSASDAPTREVLARWAARALGELRVELAEENIGFARGCNLGAALGTGRRVLLLNPDAVVQVGAVDALVAALDADPAAGVMGGRTVRPDGRLDPSSCWGAPSLWSWLCFATGLSAAFKGSRVFDPESLGGWQRDTYRHVPVVTGCLLMTTRETWDRLAGLDTDYFMYGEDADLSLRAAELGLHPAITPDAVAVHAVGASSSRKAHKVRLLMTGKATLARKRWPAWKARAGVGLLLAGAALRAAGERVRASGDPVWRPLVADRSWTAGWTGTPAPVPASR
ncbi:glycosyltransferase family 2 protein [Actinotalea fermentans]|uniref:Glycosyl transferase n=1 Tax=Actinotalea fermentans TaxID=43671 RepID=A0A511YWZ9_9CELL|nr:glycosyltransferase family 2 protein [Actinotalea fermentans]GEN79712.1 glycosyl transferase [Actinotalea fermentans]